MREILFRGQRVYNRKWTDGYYVKRQGDHLLFSFDRMGITRKVIPETVGQFIGILDKNGKKIFEGDILKCISPNDGSEFISDFIATLSSGITFKNSYLNRDMILFEYEWMEVEIIGNIYDNPELLCK